MSQPPNLPPPQPVYVDQGVRDAEHLRTLSICWIVFAILTLLPSCFGLVYMGMGIVFGGVMGAAGASSKDGGAAAAGALVGAIPCCFGGGIVGVFVTLSFLGFRCSSNLKVRRSHTLCLVTAIIACFFMPLGTLLGVFTLIVLNRPSVKATFS